MTSTQLFDGIFQVGYLKDKKKCSLFTPAKNTPTNQTKNLQITFTNKIVVVVGGGGVIVFIGSLTYV